VARISVSVRLGLGDICREEPILARNDLWNTSRSPRLLQSHADGPSFLAAIAQAPAGLGKNRDKHPSTSCS